MFFTQKKSYLQNKLSCILLLLTFTLFIPNAVARIDGSCTYHTEQLATIDIPLPTFFSFLSVGSIVYTYNYTSISPYNIICKNHTGRTLEDGQMTMVTSLLAGQTPNFLKLNDDFDVRIVVGNGFSVPFNNFIVDSGGAGARLPAENGLYTATGGGVLNGRVEFRLRRLPVNGILTIPAGILAQQYRTWGTLSPTERDTAPIQIIRINSSQTIPAASTCTINNGNQIVIALEYLHSRMIIHRDIKPEVRCILPLANRIT